jgi:hypothetical protein
MFYCILSTASCLVFIPLRYALMAAVRSFAYYPNVMYTGRPRFSYISAPLLILGVIEDESERVEELEEGSWGAYIIGLSVE